MKKILAFLVILIFCIQVSAQEEYFDYQNLLLNFKIKNSIEIVPKNPSYSVKSVQARLNYVPKESYRQKVESVETIPDADFEDGTIVFFWKNPPLNIFFEADSKISTVADFKKVKQKQNFPINNLQNDLFEYLQQGEIIDITPEIKTLASSLAEDNDDLYEVVFRLADWTEKNIQYNLSTRNVEASEPASWVLENKEGVCDEITSLFIAMCRSLGIPARFVSGIAYTNSESFEQDWGPHGWAEVYFPEQGWIPFDVTYGEFGYIDAGHIKLRESTGPKDSSVEYEYIGRDIGLDTQRLVFETSVLEKGENLEKIVDFDIDIYSREVGFGSYNMVTANIKNTKDYYVSQKVFLAKTQGTTILDEYQKNIILKPKEQKKVHWIIKVDENLDPRSVYTFPIKVYTNRGQQKKSEFKSREDFANIPYSTLESFLETESKNLPEEISLLCEPENYEIYYYEKAKINCVIEKAKESDIEKIEVCVDKSCDDYNIKGINKIDFSFEKSFPDLGLKNIPITANYGKNSKTNYIVVNVLDEPDLYISEIISPEEVSFGENFSIDFILKRKSQSFPRNISVRLVHDKDLIRYSWNFDILKSHQKFVLNSDGRMLWPGKNSFTLFIDFEDSDGKVFNQSKQFNLELVNTTLGQKGFLLLNRIGGETERVINNPEDRKKFLKNPTTWIIFAGAVTILVLLEAIMRIEKRKGSYVPHPHVPKIKKKNEKPKE